MTPEVAPQAATTATGGARTAQTVVESLGVYLPEREVTTGAIVRACRHRLRVRLERMTGIRSRHVAGDKEFSVDLAREAVARCLQASRYQAADVDLIIAANISKQDSRLTYNIEPTTAAVLRKQFGMHGALAFDLSNACAGVFTAIMVVDELIRRGDVRRALVVSGEYITHLTTTAQRELKGTHDPRLACLTLGDAGVCLLLGQGDGTTGFEYIDLYTAPEYAKLCVAHSAESHGAIMFTDSEGLARAAMNDAVPHYAELVAGGHVDLDPDLFIPHQTSSIAIRAAARATNRWFGKPVVHSGNIVDNLWRRGNTATTSHWVALSDLINGRGVRPGQKVLFSITASGVTVGMAQYRVDAMGHLAANGRHTPNGDGPANGFGPATDSRPAGATTDPSGASTGNGWPLPAGHQGGPRPGQGSAGGQSATNGSGSATPTAVPVAGCGPRTGHGYYCTVAAPDRVRIAAAATCAAAGQADRGNVRLAARAAERALAAAPASDRHLGLLVYTGVYRESFVSEPALGALVAHEMGIEGSNRRPGRRRMLAFDLMNGPPGVLMACQITGRLLAARGDVAVIAASEYDETPVSGQDPLGIANVGSALLLEPSDGDAGFCSFYFDSYPQHLELYHSYARTDSAGPPRLSVYSDASIQQRYLEAIGVTVAGLLARERRSLDDYAVIFPPQVSPQFLAQLAVTLQVEPERLVACPGGNLFTSAAAGGWEAARAAGRGDLPPGSLALFVAVGPGIEVACASYRF